MCIGAQKNSNKVPTLGGKFRNWVINCDTHYVSICLFLSLLSQYENRKFCNNILSSLEMFFLISAERKVFLSISTFRSSSLYNMFYKKHNKIFAKLKMRIFQVFFLKLEKKTARRSDHRFSFINDG